MKITIEFEDILMIVDESDNLSERYKTTIQYNDQGKRVNETITHIVDQMIRLTEVKEKHLIEFNKNK